MQGFLRTFGLCFQDFDTAFRMSVVRPFSYSCPGIMESKFSRISLVCEGTYVVPRNGPGMDKYPNIVGPNQACTLYGSQPGSNLVSGADYIEAGFSLDVNDLWRRNVLVAVGFIITQMIVTEYLQVSHPLRSRSARRVSDQRGLQGPPLEGIGFSISVKEVELKAAPARSKILPSISKRKSGNPASKINPPSKTARPSRGNLSTTLSPFPVELVYSSGFMAMSSPIR